MAQLFDYVKQYPLSDRDGQPIMLLWRWHRFEPDRLKATAAPIRADDFDPAALRLRAEEQVPTESAAVLGH